MKSLAPLFIKNKVQESWLLVLGKIGTWSSKTCMEEVKNLAAWSTEKDGGDREKMALEG